MNSWNVAEEKERHLGLSGVSSVVLRIKEQLFIDPYTGCWNYLGSLSSHGYGRIGVGQLVFRCHRLVFISENGNIPSEMIVCHRCDNPKCCNPANLFLGTHKTNSDDKISKGRFRQQYNPRVGADHPNSRLNSEQMSSVRAMKAAGKNISELSRLFGVSRTNIRNIVLGKTHKNA